MNRSKPLTLKDIESCFLEIHSVEHSANYEAVHEVRSLAEIENDYIEKILIMNGGDRKLTAEQLGISTTTLWRRISSKSNS